MQNKLFLKHNNIFLAGKTGTFFARGCGRCIPATGTLRDIAAAYGGCLAASRHIADVSRRAELLRVLPHGHHLGQQGEQAGDQEDYNC